MYSSTSKSSLHLRCLPQNFEFIFHFPYERYISHPSHFRWFYKGGPKPEAAHQSHQAVLLYSVTAEAADYTGQRNFGRRI
jgi:hypothetical protein